MAAASASRGCVPPLTYQMYLWHQVFAARLRAWGFPPSVSAAPHVDAEQPWQTNFTICAFVGALVLAAAVTFAFERPVIRALRVKHKGETI